ncbi:hypothetical protein H0H92_011008 [Tricholoma furcatifolium]|nr:hypothetical protein H0H92_011008 [Tricholoma furcatifolium]
MADFANDLSYMHIHPIVGTGFFQDAFDCFEFDIDRPLMFNENAKDGVPCSPLHLPGVGEGELETQSSPISPLIVENVSSIPWTRGGFGDVYKGTYEGKAVAIKHVRFATSCYEASQARRHPFRERWNREMQVWKSLSHPNILPFIGVTRNIASPTPGLVSPWMEKGNIAQYLTTTPSVDRLQLMKSVALGMMYLHENKVVHGDLHTANVLVDDEGSPRIADFGLSEITQGIDMDMGNLGQVCYQAPELVVGDTSSPDVACDIYSFASVCYEVLTGTRPYDYIATNIEVVLAIYEEKPPYFNSSKRFFEPPNVDKAIWDLMQSCWSRVPGQRPQMKHIYNELESYHVRTILIRLLAGTDLLLEKALAANCPMQSHL